VRVVHAAEHPASALSATGTRRISVGAVVLALSLPVLFLHVDYQPSVPLPLGGTFKLQDAAMLATLLAAALTGLRSGFGRLRPARSVWISLALFAAWIVASLIYPLAGSYSYHWRPHLVTAGEFLEYALLAPAVPLLVRRREERLLVAGSLVVWTLPAAVVGLLQWSGWRILAGYPQGMRQPSFLGPHDFAALGGAVLGLGFLLLLLRPAGRRLRIAAWVATVAGALAFALGGATALIIGFVPGTAALMAIALQRGWTTRRTAALCACIAGISAVGVLALRSNDFGQFFHFLGVRQARASTDRNVQTYSQRTLVAYIGLRIWLQNPIVGVGWQGSFEPSVVDRELPAAHRRFPDLAPLAFPTAQHEYGIQVLYLQTLADLGVIGFLLLLAVLATPLVLAGRVAFRGPPVAAPTAALALYLLLLCYGAWTAVGLVAGLPLDALTWLAVGAAATAAADAFSSGSGIIGRR